MSDANQGRTAAEPFDEATGEVLEPLPTELSPAIAAEINQQVATAKRYPRRRDLDISQEIRGRAALTEDIASECMYTLARDHKTITGPSIRFAEIVRASYGNIRVAARFVRIDADDPMRCAVIVEAVAFDLQSNTAEVIPVRRSIMTSGKAGKQARMFSADMVNTTVNAATAIARRNAILAVVPKALWIDGFQQVVKVLRGDGATLTKRRVQVMEAFARYQVKPEEVFAVIGVKDVTDVGIDHLPALIGMLTALKEGESVASVLGRGREEAAGFTPVQSPLKDDLPQSGQQSGGTGLKPAETAAAEPRPDDKTAGADAGSPRADDAPAASSGARQAEVAAESAPAATRSAAEYETHARAWIAASKSVTKITEQWKSERRLRSDCNITTDQLNALEDLKDQAIATLRAAVQ